MKCIFLLIIFIIHFHINVFCSPIIAWNLQKSSYEMIAEYEASNAHDFTMNFLSNNDEKLVVTFITHRLSTSTLKNWELTAASVKSSSFYRAYETDALSSNNNEEAAKELSWQINNQTDSVSYGCHDSDKPLFDDFLADIRAQNLKSNKIIVCLDENHSENDGLIDLVDQRLKDYEFTAAYLLVSTSERLTATDFGGYWTPSVIWALIVLLIVFIIIFWGISNLNNIKAPKLRIKRGKMKNE
eukprot:TRINITY_DN825_c0_g1_i1.p1 TRINITY_DN825_c0_g1~~TRINITY_DN825_c0_g1_i1.p1  ORF type:complete len:242 (-),score=58.97 TRINITY_DN825_c0_g1_i1:55-780(-)